MDELSEEDKMTVARARKIQRFLSQPFQVAEVFTGSPGQFLSYPFAFTHPVPVPKNGIVQPPHCHRGRFRITDGAVLCLQASMCSCQTQFLASRASWMASTMTCQRWPSTWWETSPRCRPRLTRWPRTWLLANRLPPDMGECCRVIDPAAEGWVLSATRHCRMGVWCWVRETDGRSCWGRALVTVALYAAWPGYVRKPICL